MKKAKISLILLLAIMISILEVSFVKADSIIVEYDESNYASSAYLISALHPSSGTGDSAQSENFTVPNTQVLTAAAFYLWKNPGSASFNGYLRARVCLKGVGTTNYYPNETEIIDTSEAVAVNSISEDAYDWVIFTFLGAQTLTSGTYYAVYVYASAGTQWSLTNSTYVAADTTSPTYAGRAGFYDTSSWSPNNADLIFRIYGRDVDASNPTFSSITASNQVLGAAVVLSCTVSDYELDTVIMSWNNSGAWVNTTLTTDEYGSSYLAELSSIWQLNPLDVVGVQLWANDTTGNAAYSTVTNFAFSSPSPSPTATPTQTVYTGSIAYLIGFIICIIPAIIGFLTVGPWGFLIGLNVGVALGIVSFSAYVPVWAGLLMAVMDVAALLTSGLGGKGDIPK